MNSLKDKQLESLSNELLETQINREAATAQYSEEL